MPLFLIISAACSLIYAIITVIAGWLRRRIPAVHTFAEMVEVANNPYEIALCWIVLLSIIFALVVYVGIARMAWQVSPPLAILGLLFCTLFVFTELLYRSVELFAVKRVWIRNYQQKPSETLQMMIEGFDYIVEALYFVLLAGHCLGSALLGLALWPLGGWALLISFALFVNALRTLLRILEMHLGLRRLALFNRSLYMFMVVGIFLALAVGLIAESHVFR